MKKRKKNKPRNKINQLKKERPSEPAAGHSLECVL